jgi:amidase
MTTTSIDAFSPAHAMLRSLRAREVSAVELLDFHLRRIERYNPAINAIVEPNYEQARAAAQAADAARAGGEDGALLGLPMTLKESMNFTGLRTTVGVPDFSGFRADADGPIAARVRAAGGVVMGKTNVPPNLSDWQSDNTIYGRTNNPWDLTRSPGGSTGGGAAALAAGLTPLEYGSDIGGSIRVPAAFCGLFGHRPSDTALPRFGQFPFPSAPNPVTFMGVQGPLARTAADLELAFDVVAGPDPLEELAWRLELPAARHEKLSDFRVAVLPRLPWLPLDAEIEAAQDRLVSGLGRLGVTVKEASPEALGDLRGAHRLYLKLLMATTSVRQPKELIKIRADASRALGTEFDVAMAEGIEASAGDYIVSYGERAGVRAAWQAFFQEWDVLLSPAFFTPAFEHIPASWPPGIPPGDTTILVNGAPARYLLGLGYPAIATLPGLPGTAFPAGLTSSGLPIGLQAVGPYLEDRITMRFAALVEQEFGGFRQPPGYDAD